MSSLDVVIVGASTRSAAMSARRAGLVPWCVDLFGDRDLRAIARVRTVAADQYPQGMPGLVAGWAPPAAPLLYTGALEHHPAVIAELTRGRPLWAMDPRGIPDAATIQGLVEPGQRFHKPAAVSAAPRRDTAGPSRDREGAENLDPYSRERLGQSRGGWLRKPRRGGGGRGIRFLDAGASPPLNWEREFLQEYVEGESRSAVFLADAERIVFVGLARQLVGERWLNAGHFHYCGSIGPLPAEDFLAGGGPAAIERLARRLKLRGLFGVDLIHNPRGYWFIELNPRYTASVEVHELAFQTPLLTWHARCFQEAAPLRAWSAPRAQRGVGKVVVFLPPDFPGSAAAALEFAWDAGSASAHWTVPPLADVPMVGAEARGGQPLVSLFAESPPGGWAMLEDMLRARVKTLRLPGRQSTGVNDGCEAERARLETR